MAHNLPSYGIARDWATRSNIGVRVWCASSHNPNFTPHYANFELAGTSYTVAAGPYFYTDRTGSVTRYETAQMLIPDLIIPDPAGGGGHISAFSAPEQLARDFAAGLLWPWA